MKALIHLIVQLALPSFPFWAPAQARAQCRGREKWPRSRFKATFHCPLEGSSNGTRPPNVNPTGDGQGRPEQLLAAMAVAVQLLRWSAAAPAPGLDRGPDLLEPRWDLIRSSDCSLVGRRSDRAAAAATGTCAGLGLCESCSSLFVDAKWTPRRPPPSLLTNAMPAGQR